MIHQRGYPNPPKRRQRSQEERPIRQIKDIDPPEGVFKLTKSDVREAKKKRPIRQNKDIDPPEGVLIPKYS